MSLKFEGKTLQEILDEIGSNEIKYATIDLYTNALLFTLIIHRNQDGRITYSIIYHNYDLLRKFEEIVNETNITIGRIYDLEEFKAKILIEKFGKYPLQGTCNITYGGMYNCELKIINPEK